MDETVKEIQQVTFDLINELRNLIKDNYVFDEKQTQFALSALNVAIEHLHQRLCMLEGGDYTEPKIED